MRKFGLPALEDENELDQFATSPLMDEVTRQQSMTTEVPDDGAAMDQEMNTSDELQAETADLMNRAQPMPQMPQENPKLAELRSLASSYEAKKPKAAPQADLAKLQADANANDKMLNWFKIGDKLATAYGNRHGGKGEGFGSIYEGLSKQGRQPIEDRAVGQKDEATEMTLQNEREMNDPESDISKFSQAQAVAVATKMGIPPEKVEALSRMTANQLKKLGFKTGNPTHSRTIDKNIRNPKTGVIESLLFDEQGNTIKNLGETGYSYGSMVDPNTGEQRMYSKSNVFAAPVIKGSSDVKEAAKQKAVTREDLNPKQKELLDATRTKVESNPQYQASQSAIDAAESVQSLLKGNKIDGVVLRAIQNGLARATGEKGAMTENDVAPFGGQQGILDRIQRFAQYKSVGQLPEQDVKFLNNLTKTLQDSAKRNTDEVTYVYADQLSKDLGVDLRQASGLLNTTQRLAPKQLSKEITEMVDVISPEGKPGRIPKENLEKAIKRGFKQVQ